MIHGIDVSVNQGHVDWHAVRSAGHAFAFAKATEGRTWNDPTFQHHYAGMKEAGLLRGAYHFARPDRNAARDEADHFVRVVQEAGGFDELPPVLDIEVHGGKSRAYLSAWVHAWCDRVRALTGRTPIIYASTWFASTYLDSSLAAYPLWLAHYGPSPPPKVSGWTRWTFWQHTETGRVPGVSTHVDLNVFNGSHDELHAFIGKGVSGVLQLGSGGPEVAKLQHELNQVLHISLAEDGVFGPSTQAAVKSFQLQFMGPKAVDGVVGPATQAALEKALAQLSQKAPEPKQEPKSAPQPAPQSVQTDDVHQKVAQALAHIEQASQLLKEVK